MWPDLRYGPKGECKLFDRPEDVPHGWTRRPDQPYEVPELPVRATKEELIQKLQDKGIDINPIWGIAHLQKVLAS